jgi:hypothetical protein
MTIAGAEGGLVDVSVMDPDLVVAMAKVDLGEDGGAVKAVKELIDAGEGVGIFDRGVVDGAVVDAKAEGAILLFDEEDGGAKGRDGLADVAAGEEVGELAAQLVELRLRRGVDRTVGRVGPGE